MDKQKESRTKSKESLSNTWFWKYILNNRIASILMFMLLLFFTIFMFSSIAHVFAPLRTVFSIIGPPVVFAILLYYLLNPIVNWLEHKGLGRKLAIWLVFGLILLMLGLAITFVIPGLRTQINQLIENFPQIWETVLFRIEELMSTDWLTSIYREIQATNILERVSAQITNLFTVTLDSLGTIIGSITKITITVLTLPFILYYFLADNRRFKQAILNVTPTRYRSVMSKFVYEASTQVGAYVRGQLLVAVFVAVIFYIGYRLIGLDYALILSIAAGLLNLIPYLGSIFASVPALIIGAFISPWKFLQVLLVIGIEQMLEGRLISPLILGNELDIHPLVILFILLISGSIFGVAGLILAVPGFAILRVIWQLFFEWIKENYDYYDKSEPK